MGGVPDKRFRDCVDCCDCHHPSSSSEVEVAGGYCSGPAERGGLTHIQKGFRQTIMILIFVKNSRQH